MLPHLDAAHNLARWLIRDATLAEDIVQDAYERAWKYFASFRGGSGRAWLLQIVRNTAYGVLNGQRRRMEVAISGELGDGEQASAGIETADPAPDPEAALAQRQELAALDDALNELPVAWRECLILREVESLSYKEMARVMNVPIGTVMSRLSRARDALQSRVRCDAPVAGDEPPSSPGRTSLEGARQ